jgi:hypothetical protein
MPMWKKKEFKFEEEETDFSVGGDDGGGNFQEDPAGAPVEKKKGTPPRALLLLLLLVAAAGGYYFLMMGSPEPPPPPSPAVKTQPIPISQPQAETTRAADARLDADAGTPAAAASQKAESGEATRLPSDIEAAAKPSAAPPSTPPAVPQPVVGAASAPTPAPSAAAPDRKMESEAPAPPPGQLQIAGAGSFTIQGGAFLIRGNLLKAEQSVRRLGFEPMVVTEKRLVEMTRLRVGSYAPDEGMTQLRELKEIAPDAFTIRQGDRLVLYAASFFDLDKARSFADRLYMRDIHVDEEKIQVQIPLSILSFGDFPDKAAAEKAAARAKAEGLDVTITARR